jgi:lipopolysaccharide transport system permease protein
VASAIPLLVGAGVIIALKLLSGQFAWSWFFLPVVVALLALFSLGIGWFLSLATVAFKDTQQILAFVLMMLMITSPIAYTPDMVPMALKVAMYVNPLTPFVLAFQAALVHGEFPGLGILGACAIVALAAFHGFFAVFEMGKQIVADRI